MSSGLLSSTFLFRFAVPCLYRRVAWTERGIQLEPRYRIPSFGELEGKKLFADVRAAWNRAGLSFTVRVRGKRQPIWCRDTRIEDSDGLHLWIDTRNIHNIHRAGRFCHRFAFLPSGRGTDSRSPVSRLLPINRARENPKLIDDKVLAVRSELKLDGYALEAHVSSDALTGFDPDQFGQLGFFYAVIDRELGWQTFSVGPEFPFVEDPSLWGTLQLERPSAGSPADRSPEPEPD